MISTQSPQVNLALGVTESVQVKISVSVCSGLFNRAESSTSAYLVWGETDLEWIADVDGVIDPEYTDVADFLDACLGADGPSKGYILYNATENGNHSLRALFAY